MQMCMASEKVVSSYKLGHLVSDIRTIDLGVSSYKLGHLVSDIRTIDLGVIFNFSISCIVFHVPSINTLFALERPFLARRVRFRPKAWYDSDAILHLSTYVGHCLSQDAEVLKVHGLD